MVFLPFLKFYQLSQSSRNREMKAPYLLQLFPLRSPFLAIIWLFLISYASLGLLAQDAILKNLQKDSTCPLNMFMCASTQRCIPRSWLCDQEVDCQDGEDEKNCDNSQLQCGEQEYACRTTQKGVRTDQTNPWLSHLSGGSSLFTHTCIPIKWKCDGEADCLEKDDEENCPKITCDDKHFECKSFDNSATSCIPREWVCDGQTDCLDGLDEGNCTIKEPQNQCDKNTEFRCKDGQCIYKSWRCDGDFDCSDESDEHECKEDACESVDKFKCKSTNFCVPQNWKCDGEPDCPDHSDETGCELSELHPVHTINCTKNEFRCKNGAQCIQKFWLCDGDKDCFDGSDEQDCPMGKCTKDQKKCNNGQCVDAGLWCDETEDCQDGSDERDCFTPANDQKCDNVTEYTCPGETPILCIKYDSLCKTTANDCTMKSVCGNKIDICDPTRDNACKCRNTSSIGRLCTCASGFQLDGNKKCQDINECANVGTCDQICINTPGSYQCDCYPGYKLTVAGQHMDKSVPHKCRAIGPDPLLLLANRAAIRQFDIVTNKYHPLISKLESAVALDYWHENNTLVWSDVSKEQIVICNEITGLGDQALFESINKRCTEDGENVIKIKENVTTPDGLAIDWVHGLLFWTDTGINTINVYDFNTKKRTVLLDKGLDEPRAIAVDPSAGLIFWTDWGENARIERAGMDGKNRVMIVHGESIRWPNGLAVDILDKRIYWADAKTKRISSSDYWGRNVRTILHSHKHLRHPFSLAVFEERLYWTDWDQEGVLSMNKFDGGDVKKLMTGVTGPMTVRVYHKQAQPKHENKCRFHNCQQICLPKALYKGNSGEEEAGLREHDLPFSCACEIGFQLDVGNSSMCIEFNPLLMAANTLERQQYFKGDGYGPFTYIFGLFVVCAAFVLVYTYQKRRPRHFAALHFDNPIYRRTVEADFDADIEGMVADNSLGPISILPRGGGGATSGGHQRQPGGSSFASHQQDPQSKLVLAVPVQQNNSGALINTRNPEEYGYDQPPAPKL